jgi:hypothetical protein
MGNMKVKRKAMSEEEIDRIVVSQADNETAWEKPVKVRRTKSTSVLIPAALAAQAAFFARLHREANLSSWLKRIIQERLDIEEAAFTGSKKDLLANNGR